MEVVRPDAHARVHLELLGIPLLVARHVPQGLARPGEHGPGRAGGAVGGWRFVRPDHSFEPRVLGEIGHHRLQGEIAVREMEREEAAHLEHVEIETQGLAREQVHGDGVGAEGIDHDQIVVLPGPLLPHRLHTDAGVAHLHAHGDAAGGRIRQVGEVSAVEGDVANERIDLVEGDGVAGPRVRRQRTRAEADHGAAPRGAPPVQLREESPDGAFPRVVREGLAAPRGIAALAAVQGGAVTQLRVALVAGDLEHAEEAPRLADLIVSPRVDGAGHEEQAAQGHAHDPGAPPQGEDAGEWQSVHQDLVDGAPDRS